MITTIPAANKTQDVYTWSVVYDNATIVNEYDRSEGLGFAEVDSTRVKQLRLVDKAPRQSIHMEEDPETHDMNIFGSSYVTTHCVDIPQGTTPIFFRRRPIEVNLAVNQATRLKTWHCIGWKSEQCAVYLFISDDGSSVLSDDLQAV
jgi:hypothetical protein